MPQLSTARVPTPNAQSYLRKLCQHWSHRFPVQQEGSTGTIELPTATCLLQAQPDTLSITLTLHPEADPNSASSPDPKPDQARLEQAVAEHFQRFGFRETLIFPWQRTTTV